MKRILCYWLWWIDGFDLFCARHRVLFQILPLDNDFHEDNYNNIISGTLAPGLQCRLGGAI